MWKKKLLTQFVAFSNNVRSSPWNLLILSYNKIIFSMTWQIKMLLKNNRAIVLWQNSTKNKKTSIMNDRIGKTENLDFCPQQKLYHKISWHSTRHKLNQTWKIDDISEVVHQQKTLTYSYYMEKINNMLLMTDALSSLNLRRKFTITS